MGIFSDHADDLIFENKKLKEQIGKRDRIIEAFKDIIVNNKDTIESMWALNVITISSEFKEWEKEQVKTVS